MHSVKRFAVVIAGLLIFITAFSLFIPSTVSVTRGKVIHAGQAKLFNEVSNLQNWKHWQPVFKADSAMMHFNMGADSTGYSCTWPSNGKTNTLRVLESKNSQVKLSLTREGENEVINTIRVLPLKDSGQVQVEWNAVIRLKWYPWEKFYGIFIEKISGQGYEDALTSLKTYCEQN